MAKSMTTSKLELVSHVSGGEGTSGGGKWRLVVGFWLLGMCNNFGYVVMLSAAHDLLHDGEGGDAPPTTTTTPAPGQRHCNKLSTGAILLADIIPAMLVKLVVPFFPLLIRFRVGVMVLVSLAGFLLVASSKQLALILSGVALTSFTSGLGESSLLAYMPRFGTSAVISAWSSGTGGAGVLGSLAYLGFTTAGVSPSTTIYIMTAVPLIMAVSFFAVLGPPPSSGPVSQSPSLSLNDKLRVIRKVFFVYMIPFSLVYVFEYFINQGLTELVTFDGLFLDAQAQYRWYALVYQIGVFASRSSVDLVQIDNTWLLAFLQGLNVALMTTEAVYMWLGSFWVVLVFVLWEGLLGGCSYVNTFRRINTEMPQEQRQFSMAVNTFGDSMGITISGFIAIPVHNAICKI